MPRPGDLRVGILERDHDPGDAGVDERVDARRRCGPGAQHGSSVVYSGGAAGAVAGLAQGLDLGVGAAGRLRGALADDLAVAHDDARRPTGWARSRRRAVSPERERPVHELRRRRPLVVLLRLTWSPRARGRRRGRSDDGPATHARVRRRSCVCALSHPDSHRRPRLLHRVDHTAGCRGLAGSQVVNASHYNEGAPPGHRRSGLSPNPEGIQLWMSPSSDRSLCGGGSVAPVPGWCSSLPSLEASHQVDDGADADAGGEVGEGVVDLVERADGR